MDDVAKVLGKSRRSLERMITKNQFPAPIKLTNKCVLFPLENLTGNEERVARASCRV
jgi:predicted DNA-binding transcriptional regulator AlpA